MVNFTGFFDQQSKSVADQISVALSLDTKQIAIRSFDNESILYLKPEQIKDYVALFKKDKLTLALVDANYHYHLLKYHKEELSLILSNAALLGAKSLLLELPEYDQFEAQHEETLSFIKNLLEEAKKKKVDIIFRIIKPYIIGEVAYLISNVKNIRFELNPAWTYLHGFSVTTTYRILKTNLSLITIYDCEKDGSPALIGYGSANILDLLKKSARDQFKGLFILDSNLLPYVLERQKVYQKKKFLGLFGSSKKTKQAYQKMDHKLGFKETDEIELKEMHQVTLNIIEKIYSK